MKNLNSVVSESNYLIKQREAKRWTADIEVETGSLHHLFNKVGDEGYANLPILIC